MIIGRGEGADIATFQRNKLAEVLILDRDSELKVLQKNFSWLIQIGGERIMVIGQTIGWLKWSSFASGGFNDHLISRSEDEKVWL